MFSFNFAVSCTNSLLIQLALPESEYEQKKVAKGFRRKSTIGIDCCVGAIDGILIWIHKPSDEDAEEIGFGPMKFLWSKEEVWFEYAGRV